MLAIAVSPGNTVALMLHVALHVVVPGVVALLCFRRRWWQSWLWLLAGLTIDVDHLLADPVYDPLRCSIGFHPLHTWPALLVYLLLLLHPRTRVLALGLLIHLALDTGDCLLMPGGSAQLENFLPAWIR
jgi:hypothetical protein